MDFDQLTYSALFPNQAQTLPVFTFVAKVREIQRFARIDRAARSIDGSLSGFQRPQIASHVNEIRSYLQKPEAILPNPIVVAFTNGVRVMRGNNGGGEVCIDVSKDPLGWIVDGQQRFSALVQLENNGFEVLVTAFICSDENELHKQFILINNTKPLPKSLIYELLPRVTGLPDRYSSRSAAAKLIELLNFHEDSCLKGLIKQQTNPEGVIMDTAMQKVIMNSLNDGVLRLLYLRPDFMDEAFRIVDNFFRAVAIVFPEAWKDQKPSTSRLVHGAGIMSMGYVMETLFSMSGAKTEDAFVTGLNLLKEKVAWTSGTWCFAPDDIRKWNSIQNVPRDIRQLSEYLVTLIKRNSQVVRD